MNGAIATLVTRALGVPLVAAALVGCSASKEEGRVDGTVTLDGAPLEAGQIRFVPADGQSATAGATIAAGRFAATLKPGRMRVEISAPQPAGEGKMYDGSAGPASAVSDELLPARYNVTSELSLDVVAGEQHSSFALTSK